ncbi:DUF445 domain-containing protein [Helicovermis profundi]|uniref:DUF445 family protein n=1 Tax=Helicovermis profundi TaxID=3065157 RepID=A0AAU9EQ62_9FIRM|nr:DUF445 family protein [Clostridia bacterium S502]
MIIKLLILASVGAFIGWMTNVFAIKLMFRPIKPIKFPIINFSLQGLIPKRKPEIAKSIGETVENELLSIEEIIDKMIEDTDKNEIINLIKDRVVTLAEEKMPMLVPSSIKSMILKYVEEIIDDNGEDMIDELSEKMIHHATEKVSVALIVEEKINEFDFIKLEELILTIASNELKHIEILGGIIGFLIGLVQGMIILFI